MAGDMESMAASEVWPRLAGGWIYVMGIQDRDYMRRRPDEDPPGGVNAEERLERFFGNLLRRHPRTLLYVGIGVVVIVGLAVLVTYVAG